MGVFDKLKKGKGEKEPEKKETLEKPEQSREKIDYVADPGGIFVIQLLMKEYCEMPSDERFIEVLSKHLGNVEQFGSHELFVSFFANDYLSRFKNGSFPVRLLISDCDEFDAETIDSFHRSQMWNCRNDRERILSECKYQILANDTLGGGLPPKVRANMLMDYLEALTELYPNAKRFISSIPAN